MNRSLKELFQGSMIILAMTIAAAFFGFLLRMLLTRRFSLEEFGLFYAMLGFLAPISLLKNFGINRAMVKFLPEFQQGGEQGRSKEALNWAVIVSFLTSLVVVVPFFFLSGWLGKILFHSQRAPEFFQIILIYFVVSTMGGVFSSFFNGLKKPFLLSSRSLLTALFILLAAYLLPNLGLRDLCIIHVVAHIIAVSFSIAMLLRIFPYFRIHTSMTFSGLKRLFSFGLKAMTSPLVNRVFGHLDIIILTYFHNLNQVGFYSAAQPFARLFIIFGGSIGKMIMPFSSESFASGDKEKIEEVINLLQRLILLFLMPVAIMIFLFSSQLLELLFGGSYQAGSLVVRLLVAGALIHSLTIINTHVIIGVGEPLKVTKLTTINSLFNLGGNLLLIPLWGMDGAALSTFIAYWAMFWASCRYMRSLIGQFFDWGLLVKICLASLFMVLVLKGAQVFITNNIWELLIVFFPLSSALYLSVGMLLGLFRMNEVQMLIHRRTKG